MRTRGINTELELVLLGEFDVRLNGLSLTDSSYNTMRALLAYLAVAPHREHKRETLATLLWGSQELATARGNLRRTLSDLRRVLEAPSGTALFAADRQSLRFIPDLYVDLHDFITVAPANSGVRSPAASGPRIEELERAMKLYRGEFMQGFALHESPEFEEWLALQREEHRCRALTLLERLSDTHEHMGHGAKALAFALRYIELEPWREEGHRRVMRLYALGGQPDAANRQYERCRRLLKTELGTLPGEETQALARQIRNGEVRSGRVTLVGERRQVTVLYCELTADTSLDDDEALERLHGPRARCIEIIQQLFGHLVQAHGSGLLAYFGYPQAAEEAARRAVEAALAISKLSADDIEPRIGIHTGLIITGTDDTVPDAVGKTSRLAIELRHGAVQPGVVISQATQEIVKGYFECRELKAQTLAGTTQPISLFQVVRDSGARTRLEAAAALAPLVGRKPEIATLWNLWQEATRGQPHTVLVQGEAGIGKSRLLHTLKERLHGIPHVVREVHCFPEFSHSTFHPLLTLLEEVLGFARQDSAEQKALKLAAYFETRNVARAKEAVPLLGQLLSLPALPTYPAVTHSPQEFKERVGIILLELVRTFSTSQPLLLIVEDLHCADPSTLEWLQRHIEQPARTAMLTLLTARPEFVPHWPDRAATRLPLPPLSASDVAELIASIDAEIQPTTLRHIVEHTDGVALYAEEMTRFVATQEGIDAIPGTLRDLLAARIDRLGSAKQTAQLAATLGREFSLEVLHRLLTDEAKTVAEDLGALCDTGLVFRLNATTYRFKHSLIQEAAYQSQTRANRQAAHRQIAQILLDDFPEAVAAQPELIARHYYDSGNAPRAVEYWLKAGHRSLLNASHTEAFDHLHKGLRALTEIPAGEERDKLKFGLNLRLGAAWSVARGYGSTEAKEAYADALKLGSDVSDSAGLFAALHGLWVSEHAHGGNSHAIEVAEQLLHLAQQTGHAIQRQVAHQCMGTSTGTVGDLYVAQHHFEQALALYQPAHHQAMVSQYGENIRVNSGVHLAMALWLRGFPDRALAETEASLALARAQHNPHVLCFALNGISIITRWRGEPEMSEQFARECLTVSDEFELPLWRMLGSTALAWVRATQGHGREMDALLAQLPMDDGVPAGLRLLVLHQVGEGLVYLKRFDEALESLNESITLADRLHERFVESEYHRLKGICLMERTPADEEEAEACFGKALTISRGQEARMLELRAAIGMAKLYQRQKRCSEALTLLREIHNGFSEGLGTPDVRQAATLIEQL